MKTFLKRMAAVAVVSVASAFSVNTAFAGGDVYQAPVAKPTIWKGFYFGGHAGIAQGETDIGLFNAGIVNFKDDAFAAGLHVGYNWQRGNIVYGLEADYTWTGLDIEVAGRRDSIELASLDGLGSVRARLGYAINDLLLFATAGIAWRNVDTHAALDGIDVDETGYVLGAGAELKVGQKYSLKLEALNYTFDSDDLAANFRRAPLVNEDTNITVVRTGLSIHF